LPPQKSSTQHSFTADDEIISAYDFLANAKIIDETESLPTQKSSMQPLSLSIQKSAATMESFLLSLLSFGQA
jgi:hypothetical protein